MSVTSKLESIVRPPQLERLSSLDAEFLHVEDDKSPMHIAAMCIFEGPVPSRDDITRLIASKLPRLPRYRQVLRVPPLELGRPVWVDDANFKLQYHIRRMALASPHDEAALNAVMGRLMELRLDRDRPLWEVYVIEGLQDGRWALVSKTHHAMVDGIAGSNLMVTLLDDDAGAPVGEPAPWEPRPEPSGPALVWDAWLGYQRDLLGLQRTYWRGIRHPGESLRTARDLTIGLGNLWRTLLTTTRGPTQGTIGKHRAYAHAVVPLADVQRVRKALGGTVNDVVLAAVAGGYRALLAHRGIDPDHEVMRSLVPVSVRAPDAHGIPNNQVSFLLCDLSVNVRHPVERLGAIQAEMKRLKKSRMPEAVAWLNSLRDLTPPAVAGPATRSIARMMHRFPMSAYSTVTTNVPGPTRPLYMLGRKMRSWYPYVPITQGLRVGTAIISYGGCLGFGLTADYDTVPDVDAIAHGIEESLAELIARADQISPKPVAGAADAAAPSTTPQPTEAAAPPTLQPRSERRGAVGKS